jgi:hypothetical protein
MTGIFLGGKYTKSPTVDLFLLLNDYKYNYIVSKYGSNYYYYQQGAKSYCSTSEMTSEMVHAAPLKLVSWEW